jgi:hypothetical protein
VHGNGQKPTETMKKSEKTHQGLYNVGFIGKRMANGNGTFNLEALAFVMNAERRL